MHQTETEEHSVLFSGLFSSTISRSEKTKKDRTVSDERQMKRLDN